MFSSTCRPLRTGQDITTMAEQAIAFALANRDPEVDPFAAGKHAAIMATGRSDYPSQINNVLAFPGFFRGMLDSGAHEITDDLLLAAATATADTVASEQLNANYIVPSVFYSAVAPAVADAIQSDRVAFINQGRGSAGIREHRDQGPLRREQR